MEIDRTVRRVVMNDKLKHLNEKQIEELMNRYYSDNGETAAVLINEYNLDVLPSRLYTLFPDVICDEKCKWCQERLQMPALSKTARMTGSTNKKKTCPNCGHVENIHYCHCENCQRERIAERELKEKQEREKALTLRRQIHEAYRYEGIRQVELEEINFEERVSLGAILRGFLSEDMTTINPIDIFSLTSDANLSCELIRALCSKGILLVDSTSDIEAFKPGENFPNTYYLDRVKYRLNLKFPPNKEKFIKELLSPKGNMEFSVEDALYLWKKIAVSECIEYLLYQFDKVGFEFSAGKKTYAMFEELLDDFSVSQIYAIIYPKVANASKLYLERTLTKKHAANTVISTCQTYGERIRIEGWAFKGYSRIKELPQSIISEYFFNKVLGIGDRGFNMCPVKELYENDMIEKI